MLKCNFLAPLLTFFGTFKGGLPILKRERIHPDPAGQCALLETVVCFFQLLMPWTLFKMPNTCRHSLWELVVDTNPYQNAASVSDGHWSLLFLLLLGRRSRRPRKSLSLTILTSNKATPAGPLVSAGRPSGRTKFLLSPFI